MLPREREKTPKKRKEEEMFCPFIKSECRDDCACFDDGECRFVNALRPFESVDPIDLAHATEFVANLNERSDDDLYVHVRGSVTAYNE